MDTRQPYSAEFKQQIVQEAKETGNAALVARRHQLNAGMIRRWIRAAAQAEHGAAAMPWVDENERLKRL